MLIHGETQTWPANWPLLTIESPVTQCLEHPIVSRRVVVSNPIWDPDWPCLCFSMYLHLIIATTVQNMKHFVTVPNLNVPRRFMYLKSMHFNVTYSIYTRLHSCFIQTSVNLAFLREIQYWTFTLFLTRWLFCNVCKHTFAKLNLIFDKRLHTLIRVKQHSHCSEKWENSPTRCLD